MLNTFVAWWCCRYWSHCRLWYRACPRRTSWDPSRVFVRWSRLLHGAYRDPVSDRLVFSSRDTQVMAALGEMSAYMPHKKGFAGYATRFVDPAFGFALGWNYLFKYVKFAIKFVLEADPARSQVLDRHPKWYQCSRCRHSILEQGHQHCRLDGCVARPPFPVFPC